MMVTDDLAEAWGRFTDALAESGRRLLDDCDALDIAERADALRALVRALNNQLSRFEGDREDPELVPFNGWRHKMLMDNPDFAYWVADIRDDRSYVISGSIAGAAYMSITVYDASGSLDANASARIDSDDLDIDDAGNFRVLLQPADVEPPRVPSADDHVDRLVMPAGVSVVWVRQFHHSDEAFHNGMVRIEAVSPRAEPTADHRAATASGFIDPERFVRKLDRLSRSIGSLPAIISMATAADMDSPNTVRHWTEMTGGAAFTEPGIHYLRGSWKLDPGQALVIEGAAPVSRYWSVLLYSRFLNSLDHRSRTVSMTDRVVRTVDGRYRIVIADRDDLCSTSATGDVADLDLLDTEGRPFGLFVFRFLHPSEEPELPEVRICRSDDLVGLTGRSEPSEVPDVDDRI